MGDKNCTLQQFVLIKILKIKKYEYILLVYEIINDTELFKTIQKNRIFKCFSMENLSQILKTK